MPETKYADVVIVGAGPSGLATAASLRRAIGPNLSIAVYERSTSQQPRGAGLRLELNALKALKSINPLILDQVVQNSVPASSLHIYNQGGTLVASNDTTVVDDEFLPGVPTNRLMGWWELQQVLLKHVVGDSETTVTFGKTFKDAQTIIQQPPPTTNSTTTAKQQQQPLINVWFEEDDNDDDPTPTPSIRCKILIGCDGYRSKIASHNLNLPLPRSEHSLVWRARLPAQHVATLFSTTTSTYIDKIDMDQGDCTMILSEDPTKRLFTTYYPVNNGDVVWTVGVPETMLDEHTLARLGLDTTGGTAATTTAGTSPVENTSNSKSITMTSAVDSVQAKKKQSCIETIQCIATAHPNVLKLIEATPASTVLEHGVYIREPEDLPFNGSLVVAVVSGSDLNTNKNNNTTTTNNNKFDGTTSGSELPITIAGDALHPMRPTGHGIGTAIEDAIVLAKNVALHGVNAIALRAYEAERLPRVVALMCATTESGRSAYKEGNAKETARRAPLVDKYASSVEWPDLVSLRGGGGEVARGVE